MAPQFFYSRTDNVVRSEGLFSSPESAVDVLLNLMSTFPAQACEVKNKSNTKMNRGEGQIEKKLATISILFVSNETCGQ